MSLWKTSPVVALLWVSPALAGPLEPAKWLVDLGRDYPLSPQAALSDADAEITLLFMQAAGRLDPALAEAHLWQYDMLSALGRTDAARQALVAYVDIEQSDVAADLEVLATAVEALHTAEERAQLCRSILQRPNLSPEVASDLHRRLAEFHYNRGEMTEAQSEAEAAVKTYEFNFAASDLLDEIRKTTDHPDHHIARLLKSLELSPADVDLAAELADTLTMLGMVDEADRWYRHAISVAELMPPGIAPPDLVAARAMAMIDVGKLSEAGALAEQVVKQVGQAGHAYAHLVLARVARKQRQEQTALGHMARATEACKTVLADSGKDLEPDELAAVAWFFAHHDPQPEAAAKLARAVLAESPTSTIARRALGESLRRLGELQQAEETLLPIADKDVWAAVALAQTLRSAGKNEQAVERLQAACTRPATGEQRDTMAALISEWTVTPPTTQPVSGEIVAMLQAFPGAVLEYPAHPEKFLSLTMRMPAADLPPAEPWRLTVELKNIGPFPISIGGGMMVQPSLLCSIETRGDQVRTSGPTIPIHVHRRLRLKPGESLTVTQTIDIGPIRASMIGTPQVTHTVEVSAVLSPMHFTSDDGRDMWAPGVGGLLAPPLKFRRTALDATASSIRTLVQRSRSDDVGTRTLATEQIAMLIGESQHLAAGRLRYAVPRIDEKMLLNTLLARADDSDWQVRAHLAECMRWFVLDKEVATPVAMGRLRGDTHWLVRGLALRMLSDQYRHKFAPVLQWHADNDPDDWVRRLAGALLDRLRLTSQPAEPPASRPE